jgi:hypothetical protein
MTLGVRIDAGEIICLGVNVLAGRVPLQRASFGIRRIYHALGVLT